MSALQLALDPIRLDPSMWPLKDVWKKIDGAGLTIASGMMAMRGEDYSTLGSIRASGGLVPDEHWEANLAAAAENAEIAHQFGIEMVTFHAGFIPHAGDEATDGQRAVLMDRIVRIADIFAERDVTIALETGQESTATLISILDEIDHPMIGVNFDPANMILYGMGDPVQALRDLALFIDQVHIKDAVPGAAGAWGTEAVVGTPGTGQGGVDWAEFFKVVQDEEIECNFLIEREAGTTRIDDVRAAVKFVRQFGLRPESV